MSTSFQVAVAKSYDVVDVRRDAMLDSKIQRGKLSFMQRMEADSHNKRINGQLSEMRRDETLKARVDKIAINKTRPSKESTKPTGPTIVTHSYKKVFEGHSKKQEWAPLDMY